MHNSAKKKGLIADTISKKIANNKDCSNVNTTCVENNHFIADVDYIQDADAIEAVKNLLNYIGEDINREGLIDTPQRVLKAFSEYFSGYKEDAEDILNKTFDEVDGFDGPISLQDIEFISHCEHHLAPFVGKVSITYYPSGRIVGLSKLARIVDTYAKRLQIQERMTAQIANVIHQCLQPKAVRVIVEASHFCMNYRGVNKPSSKMVTTQVLGDSEFFANQQ